MTYVIVLIECHVPDVPDLPFSAEGTFPFLALFSHFCAACKLLQWHSNIVRNDSVTDDPAMEQGDKGPLKVPFRICGGFDGSVAGSILVKWCFFSGQSTGYGKICIFNVIFCWFASLYYIVHLKHFLSCSNLNPDSNTVWM